MTGPSSPRCPWCEAPNPAGQAFCGSCGLELGVGPSPSPSLPPAAKPPFDLLRARNVYAFVIVTVVVFLAVSAAGWLSQSSGSPAVAPTSPPAASRPAPIATLTSSPTLTAATPTPTPTPAPTASPSPTATPSPAPSTPTIAQAARGYLALATTYEKAVEAAYRKYGRTSTLKAQKAYWGALATADAVFIADRDVPAAHRPPAFGHPGVRRHRLSNVSSGCHISRSPLFRSDLRVDSVNLRIGIASRFAVASA
jgi:hypothetical protein